MKEHHRIVMISPYPELSAYAAQVSKEMNISITIYEEVLEKAVHLACQLKKDDIDCIISRGATGILVKNNVSVPVILVQISTFDVLQAFYKAKALGKKIAYFEHYMRKNTHTLQQIFEILNLSAKDVDIFYYKDVKSIEAQVEAAAIQQADVAIATGYCTLQMAKQRGMHGVMISSTRDAVIDAFQRAIDMIKTRRNDQNLAKLLKTVIDNSDTGIIVLDEHKKISHFNTTSEKFLRIKKEEVVGLALKDLPNISYELKDYIENNSNIPAQMINIGGNRILVNSVPLLNEKNTFGVMLSLEGVNKIQLLEAKIRKELYARGLVSRYSFDDIVHLSPVMKRIIESARRYAKTKSTVLIYGESGTGKELIAHSIHAASPCNNGPFVAVNCAAIPETLLESELFGYSEGAFSGAKKGGKLGLFELAHGGTIFLDEISEIPLLLQARLLRVLQEKAVRRVGDDKIVPVDVRIIVASNQDLSRMVAENRFRKDLYFRINVLSINVLPLRERKEDIFVLLEAFIKQSRFFNHAILSLFEQFRMELEDYSWPGNIRELENFVERFLILSEDASDPAAILQSQIRGLYSLGNEYLGIVDEPVLLGKNALSIKVGTLEEMEKEILEKMQKLYPSEKKASLAQQLNISRTTLWKKLKTLEEACNS